MDGAAFSLHPQFMHFELYKIRKENQYFKKVNCYYKCPVAKQVSKKLTVGCKIARQQAACQEFDQKMGWDIAGEIEGSGPASPRDFQHTGNGLPQLGALPDLKNVDILLVFMFDRLIHNVEEIPNVLE